MSRLSRAITSLVVAFSPVVVAAPAEAADVPRITVSGSEFYRSGVRFVPRGSNYLAKDAAGSPFEPGRYDHAAATSALASMASNRYNVVRVRIHQVEIYDANGTPGAADPRQTALDQGYLANMASFVNEAAARGVYVMLVADFIPDNGSATSKYEPSQGAYINGTWMSRRNQFYLYDKMIDAQRTFLNDLLRGLVSYGTTLSNVFSYNLSNEQFFVSTEKPFTNGSDTISGNEIVGTQDGGSYDMRSTTAQQQMMDNNLRQWANKMRDAIRLVDPQALVGVGFFSPTQGGDKGWVVRTLGAFASSADFVDVHAYPEYGKTLQTIMNAVQRGSYVKPIVMGELGSRYPNTGGTVAVTTSASAAGSQLQTWIRDSCATTGARWNGWLAWTWDSTIRTGPTANSGSYYWAVTEENGMVNSYIAPNRWTPPCG